MTSRTRVDEPYGVDTNGQHRGAAELFAGPGEVRALARTLDWDATPLGWPDTWSPALRIATRAMLDSPFPICLWSGPTFALVYNDAYRRILAAKHPAALGQPGSTVWAEIWAELEEQFAQVRGGGPPLSFENARFVMARLEGGRTEDAWFSYSLSALRDEDGSVAAVLNISPETTGRVLAERALEVERARLEDVFRRAPSFIVAFRGAEHRYDFVNEAYYQLVGHRAILGKPLLDAIPELRGQGFDELLTRVLVTGEPWVGRETPVVLQRTPGAPLETRFLDMVFQPLVEADGTRSGVVVHGSDISEQVRARRDAERARERADGLQSLTAALAATTTPEEVADVVVAQGVTATGAAAGMLVLRAAHRDADDGEVDELVMLRHSGLTDMVATGYARFPVAAPVPTATSVRTGQSFFLEDRVAMQATFPAVRHVWESLGTSAIAALPLTVGGEAVGAMSFAFTDPRAFPEEDREFFLALGRQAAQSLERVRLAGAQHTARMRAESLQRVTAALARAQSLEVVGQVFSREITTLLGADSAWVGVVTADGTAVEALGWSGYTEVEADRWRRLPLELKMALPDAVRLARPQWWPSREALADAYPARAAQIRALAQDAVAVLPIPGEGEGGRAAGAAVGGIVVGFRTPQRFDADTQAFYLALAQQCAQAIARARAYEAEQAARREAEAARGVAEAANRAKGEFLAVMSHELRTPLNAIGGYAELMEMGIHGPVTPEQRTALERIRRSQRSLLSVINEVLNYARLETGAVTYDVVDVRVAEVVGAAEVLVAPQLRARGLVYQWEGCDAELTARADRDKLQQILLNLLSNAIKFTEPRDGTAGRVHVSCARDADAGRVLIRVHDTGVGIAGDKLESIFEPFVQVDTSLTRTQQGTGLGLAISRDLARGMGGDLAAESTPGVGSTFTLSLPLAS